MITIVSGTNRPNSFTKALADYYLSELSNAGAEVKLLNLDSLPIELLSSAAYKRKPSDFEAIQSQITLSEKFVFIIPEYNGSYPGVLKLFIDNCQYPQSFYHKKACLVGLSAGKYGNIRGVEHFSGVCAYLHMHVHPLRIHIPLIKSEFDAEKNLLEGEAKHFIDEQISGFLTF